HASAGTRSRVRAAAGRPAPPARPAHGLTGCSHCTACAAPSPAAHGRGAAMVRVPTTGVRPMARCDVCGNEYDKAFQITLADGSSGTYDSFECAIHAVAPQCEH